MLITNIANVTSVLNEDEGTDYFRKMTCFLHIFFFPQKIDERLVLNRTPDVLIGCHSKICGGGEAD